jgi:multisubunit Na+/H+ antiporter MnhC subunit
MKINPFLSVLSLLLAALIAYALYYYCKAEDLRWLLTIGGGISLFLVWAGTLAVRLENKQRNVNYKVMSSLFALIITAVQIVFAFHAVTSPVYLLWTGILLIIWLILAYVMAK